MPVEYSTLIYDGVDGPIQIETGRGDLRFMSSRRDGTIAGLSPAYMARGPAPGHVQLVGGRTVSHAQLFAEQWSVAAAVMRLLTWSVKVPLKTYRRADGARKRLRTGEHRVADVISNPWTRGSQAALVQSLLGPLLVHGNTTMRIDEGADGRLRFVAEDWRDVVAQRDEGELVGWQIKTDHRDDRYVLDEVLHVAWWSPLGALGISPLQQLGTTIGIEDAAQRHQKAMLSNSARPPSAVTASEQFLGLHETERSEMLANLRADITSVYGGPEQAGRPALLPPGLDWKPVGHNAQEAQLIEQRKVAREEVCAVFQIPPPMLGIYDNANFNNVEAARELAYTDALAPPLVLIEQTLNAHLVRDLLGEPDVFVEFDFAAVLRGNRLKEVEALRDAIGSGLLAPNEGRQILNLEPVDEPVAGELWMPANNLAPMSAVAAQASDETAGNT